MVGGGGGRLAEHPLICHHQRMFGSRENGKENEKKRRKGSSGETAARLCIADVQEVIDSYTP